MPSKKISLVDRMTDAPYRRKDAGGPRCGVCRLPPKVRAEVEEAFKSPDFKPWVALDYLREIGHEYVSESMIAYHRRARHFQGVTK